MELERIRKMKKEFEEDIFKRIKTFQLEAEVVIEEIQLHKTIDNKGLCHYLVRVEAICERI